MVDPLSLCLFALAASCAVLGTLPTPQSIDSREAANVTPTYTIPYHQQRCISDAYLDMPHRLYQDQRYVKYDIRVGREFTQAKCDEFTAKLKLKKNGLYLTAPREWNLWGNTLSKFHGDFCTPITANYMRLTMWIKPNQEAALNKILAETFPVVHSIKPFKCLGSTSGG